MRQTQAVVCSTPLLQSSSATNHPVYKPISSAKKEPMVNVKVIQAVMTKNKQWKKTDFQRQGQLFIDVLQIFHTYPAPFRGNDYALVTVKVGREFSPNFHISLTLYRPLRLRIT